MLSRGETLELWTCSLGRVIPFDACAIHICDISLINVICLRRGSSTRQGGDGDEDCASITTIDPHVKQVQPKLSDHRGTEIEYTFIFFKFSLKQWMVAVSRGDYQSAAKMLIDDPKLARYFWGKALQTLIICP